MEFQHQLIFHTKFDIFLQIFLNFLGEIKRYYELIFIFSVLKIQGINSMLNKTIFQYLVKDLFKNSILQILRIMLFKTSISTLHLFALYIDQLHNFYGL